jgi:DNA-binding response OmpR family regulator
MEARSVSILIADDEAPIRTTLSALLRRRGYEVSVAEHGEQAITMLYQQPFDLLLLDLKMPKYSGIEVARQAKNAQPGAAVIILTGHGSLESAIEGMHLDVFDYILKSTSPQEVLSRVEAALTRQEHARQQQQLFHQLQSVVHGLCGEPEPEPASPAVATRLVVGDVELSTWNQDALVDGRRLNLTRTEFRILACLAQHADTVMTYQQLVHCAHGYAAEPLEASELVKPHIHHLRQKIESEPTNPRHILTVRGTGYMLVTTPADARAEVAFVAESDR